VRSQLLSSSTKVSQNMKRKAPFDNRLIGNTVVAQVRKVEKFFNGANYSHIKSKNNPRPSSVPKVTDYTTRGWIAPSSLRQGEKVLTDARIVDLGNGIDSKDYPTQESRGVLTEAIAFATENGLDDVRVSEIEDFVEKYGLNRGIRRMRLSPNPDKKALIQCKPRLKALRKQYEAEAKARKGEDEGENIWGI
jgi:hypothetical protein